MTFWVGVFFVFFLDADLVYWHIVIRKNIEQIEQEAWSPCPIFFSVLTEKNGHGFQALCSSKEEAKMTNTQENITHKRAKRSALSQQVTTRLQGTDKTV